MDAGDTFKKEAGRSTYSILGAIIGYVFLSECYGEAERFEIKTMAELTDEQIKAEEEFMRGLPRFNVAAFLLPPIWGPAHGFWVTILYYPIWLFVDNLFFATYNDPQPLGVILSILAFAALLGITIAFAIVSQPIAAHRAQDKGISRRTYMKRQRYWAIGCAIGAVVMLSLATYYNLVIRPTVGQ